MRVLAIDFETANSSMTSACSIGYTLFEEGEIKESREILIKPPKRYGIFNYYNVQIHGITPDMVENCESWPYVFNDICHLFHDSLVIAHNARFDMSVLKAMNCHYGIEMDDFPYVDTVLVSRCLYPFLNNHKLNTVAEYLGLDFRHHHAGSDSLACLAIMEDAMQEYGEYDVWKLMEIMNVHCLHYSDIKIKK